MTREEANQLVEIYGRHRGVFGAHLNQHDLVGFLWEGGNIYLEYFPEDEKLVAGAKVTKFRGEPKMRYYEALKEEEARGTRDMGGGTLEFDPISKGIFITRPYPEVPENAAAFCEEIDALGTAGNEWFYHVYQEVVFPIMRAERGE